MQLIILTAIVTTLLTALSIEVYKRYLVAQEGEQQALWPHIKGGSPPNKQMLKRLSGLWLHETEQRRARLRMTDKGLFQLITRRKDLITRRAYIRGYYRVDDRTLFLRQDDRLGRPYVKNRPEIRFIPMRLGKIGIDYDLGRRGQRMIWQFDSVQRIQDIKDLQYRLTGQLVERVKWHKVR